MHPDFDPVPDCNSSFRARNWQFGAASEAGRCAFFLTTGRLQHFHHHLPPYGATGFVLANASMSSNQSGDCPARSAMKTPKAKPQSLPRQRDIRRALIEADLVDCMVALPGQLFYSTQIPVCLWFLAKNKAADAKRGFRVRRKDLLFISRKPTFINFSYN